MKREDETHAQIGGTKIRKLSPLLADAAARGATHLLTIGAIGSNHVLATAVHGAAAGFGVIAALVPHPTSASVIASADMAAASGARSLAARNEPHAVLRIALEALRLRRRGARPYFIPPGGTSAISVPGCAAGGAELAEQVTTGELPGWPAAAFCAMGSGGTAAGLWAALSTARAPTVLHAVRVYPSVLIGPAYLARLARRVRPEHGFPRATLRIDATHLGGGYGAPTDAGRQARQLFATDGVDLDLTYTAKAAAALISFARGEGRGQRLLLWYSAPGALKQLR